MRMASCAQQCFTVLMDEDGVPGSKFGIVKRWMKCRGLKFNGKRDELLKRVPDCLKSGNHHTLYPSTDNGKWFAAKNLKAQRNKQIAPKTLFLVFLRLAGAFFRRRIFLRSLTMGTCRGQKGTYKRRSR